MAVFFFGFMSKISKEKEEKVKEALLRELYDCYPGMLFTYDVAGRIARDEEFVLRLMKDMQAAGLLIMREEGESRIKRKWGLKGEVWERYKDLLK